MIYTSQSLKDALERVVPEKQKEILEFRKTYGNEKLGEYTIDQVSDCIICIYAIVLNYYILIFPVCAPQPK